MTPAEAARRIEAKRRALRANLNDALRRTAREGKRTAQFFSSGAFSQAQLDALGNPYSVNNPGRIPYDNPAIINFQTGDFYRSWQISPVVAMSASIVNQSKEATFLNLGTSRMIRRPIREAVILTLGPTFRRECEAAIRKGINA